ncbi:MAG: VPLPA-CTERM sorting domain-containing protein [Pseudomonadota bacterium]
MRLLAFVVAAFLPAAALAAPIQPIYYSYIIAPNGGSAYLDDTYNGTTGQLTDGISATLPWSNTDGFGAPGPNVGWQGTNPTIQFNFDQVYSFGAMVVNFQDNEGAFGVGLAETMTVNGVTSPTLTSPNAPGGGNVRSPIDVTMDLTAVAPTDTLTLTINREFFWTFVSEVSFDSTPPTAAVPVPASLPLLLGCLGVIGLLARRRRP